ncbi:MAG: 3'-5' exoribonuclease YhaM family protein [Candidatus Muiribacteriaceae bacterium]
MKNDSHMIKGLKTGKHTIVCLLAKLQKRSFNNRPGEYLDLELCDRSGSITGRKWDNIEKLAGLKPGTVLEVTGDVSEYRGQMQLIINKARVLADKDPTEFLPSYSDDDIQAARKDLEIFIGTINDSHINRLCVKFMGSALYPEFVKAPAAKGFHHNMIGGLLIHTVSVIRLCDNIAALYSIQGVSRDILIAGALLHDVGKIREYRYSDCIDLSDEGRLLGHITIGIGMLNDLVSDIPGFPDRYLTGLRHMILSHHGQYEWGSPKMPKTIEALILHHADNLDSRIEGIRKVMDEAKGQDNTWSARFDGRPFYCEGYEEDIAVINGGELF